MADVGVADRTTMHLMLKDVWRGRLQELIASRSVLLQAILRNNVDNLKSEGAQIVVPLEVGGGGGYAYSPDETTKPPSHPLIDKATFNTRMITDTIEVSQILVEDTKSNAAAVAPIMDTMMSGVARDHRHALNYDLYQDGTGKVAQITGATASDTLTVSSWQGLFNNQLVDIVLNATGAAGSAVKTVNVTVLRSNTGDSTVKLLNGAALNDYADVEANASDYGIYRHKGWMGGIFGLNAIISDSNPPSAVGNYGNVDRDVDDWWRATVLDAQSDRALTMDLIQDAVDGVEAASDGEITLVLVGPRQWLRLVHDEAALRRHRGQVTTLMGWAEGITFGRTRIVKDKHCPNDRAFALSPDDFRIWQPHEGGWLDEEGSILKHVAGTFKYQGIWYRRLQLVCRNPMGSAVITDLLSGMPT